MSVPFSTNHSTILLIQINSEEIICSSYINITKGNETNMYMNFVFFNFLFYFTFEFQEKRAKNNNNKIKHVILRSKHHLHRNYSNHNFSRFVSFHFVLFRKCSLDIIRRLSYTQYNSTYTMTSISDNRIIFIQIKFCCSILRAYLRRSFFKHSPFHSPFEYLLFHLFNWKLNWDRENPQWWWPGSTGSSSEVTFGINICTSNWHAGI